MENQTTSLFANKASNIDTKSQEFEKTNLLSN